MSPHPWLWLRSSLLILVCFSLWMTLQIIAVLLVDYSILPLLVRIFLLQLTVSASIFMSPVTHIGLQSNAFCVMFVLLLPLVCILGQPPLECCLPSLMRTGRGVQMIGDLRGDMLCFLVQLDRLECSQASHCF